LNPSPEQKLGKPNVSTTPSLRHIRRCERTLLAAPTPHKEDRVKLSSALQEPFSKLLCEASFQRKLFSSSKIQTYTCVDNKQQQVWVHNGMKHSLAIAFSQGACPCFQEILFTVEAITCRPRTVPSTINSRVLSAASIAHRYQPFSPTN